MLPHHPELSLGALYSCLYAFGMTLPPHEVASCPSPLSGIVAVSSVGSIFAPFSSLRFSLYLKFCLPLAEDIQA